jgi:hypothetical protein
LAERAKQLKLRPVAVATALMFAAEAVVAAQVAAAAVMVAKYARRVEA